MTRSPVFTRHEHTWDEGTQLALEFPVSTDVVQLREALIDALAEGSLIDGWYASCAVEPWEQPRLSRDAVLGSFRDVYAAARLVDGTEHCLCVSVLASDIAGWDALDDPDSTRTGPLGSWTAGPLVLIEFSLEGITEDGTDFLDERFDEQRRREGELLSQVEARIVARIGAPARSATGYNPHYAWHER